MDVIIFSGQSNMQGSTGQEGCSKAKNCLEYKFLTDEFVEVKDPVGENIGEDLLCGPVLGCGSLVPSFCKAYAKKKGSVIVIHCAKGNTTIADWGSGTERYKALVRKAKRGIMRARENFGTGKVYFVWLQGEMRDFLQWQGAEELTITIGGTIIMMTMKNILTTTLLIKILTVTTLQICAI